MAGIKMTLRLGEKENEIVNIFNSFLKTQKTGQSKNKAINKIIREWAEDRTLIEPSVKKKPK
jgi:hypothetical protein